VGERSACHESEVEDKDFLKRAYSECAGIVNQLVQELKHYGIDSAMKVVGSKSRNMVMQNANEPIDFDFNLLVNNDDDFRDAGELKEIVKEAFDEVLSRNGQGNCHDSTSVLTTRKKRFSQGNRTEFSMDICIVKRDGIGQWYRLIHEKNEYVQLHRWYWVPAPNSHGLSEKESVLKSNPKDWNLVRETYRRKKNEKAARYFVAFILLQELVLRQRRVCIPFLRKMHESILVEPLRQVIRHGKVLV